jgi:hypothetical protein
VVKDRAAPFSRKHRRTYLTVTGMMILIGLVNLLIGLWLYARSPKDAPRKEQPRYLGGPALDAGVYDAGPPRQ